MQWTITINQKAIVEAGFELDLEDAVILDFIRSFSSSRSIQRLNHEGQEYYWFAYKKVIEEIPLLGIKSSDSVYRRFRKLTDLGLLKPHPDNASLGRAYYATTPNFLLLFHSPVNIPGRKSDPPDTESGTPGSNAVPPPDGKPDNTNTIDPTTRQDNTPLPPKGGTEDADVAFEKEKENTVSDVEIDLQGRQAAFKKEVYDIGRLTYTERMLSKFVRTYNQPDGSKKPLLRWEKERRKKGWSTADRLEMWANRNLEGIPCYLTAEEKSIKQKRFDFAESLKPYSKMYAPVVLNAFYRHWGQPENVPNPTRLRWECESFWELSTRLKSWYEQEIGKRQTPQPPRERFEY